MPVFRPVLRLAFFAVMATSGAGRAGAQLIAVSPFLPLPAAATTAAPTAGASLEFRGVANLAGAMKFRVVDLGRKGGAWVRLNEREPDLGFVAREYDASRDMLTVDYEGRTLRLALHEGRVMPGGLAVPNTPLTQVANPSSVVIGQATLSSGGSVAIVGTAGSPSQLEALAAEAARRRLAREQATPPAAGVQLQLPGPAQNQTAPRGRQNTAPIRRGGGPGGTPIP